MRAAPVLLLLVVAGVIGYFAWPGDTTAAPPSHAPTAPGDAPKQPAPTATSERTTVPPPSAANSPEASPTPTGEHAGATATANAATTSTGNVVLRVRDVATGDLVPQVRWRFRGANGDQRGEGRGEKLELALPPDVSGELLLEADGHQPLQRADVRVPPENGNPLLLDLFLVPSVTAAGITLLVHDPRNQPIPHVRVDAFRIDDKNRDLAWHLGNAMWARRAHNEEGRYVLPPLPAGEYGLRLVATDADGNLQPWLPYAHVFRVTGDNGFVEDVPLEPGCVPLFELVDVTGNPYDPSFFGTATLGLHEPGAPAVQRKWVVANGAVLATALDVLPGLGPCWPAEPVPPGNYTFEVIVNGNPRVQTTLTLRAGEMQHERILVP